MTKAKKQTTTRVISRQGNIVAVDFGSEPPDPKFPGAGAQHEDHPSSINADDDIGRVALWPRGRRIAA
jgi:hypothetical protein